MTRGQKKIGKKVDGRRKGNRYEREIGKKLALWARDFLIEKGLSPKDYFIRSPSSGGWNRNHVPGEDLITPPGFAPALELKDRQNWSWVGFLSGKRGKNQVWGYWDEAVERVGERALWLIFAKNYEPDWLLMKASLFEEINSDRTMPEDWGLILFPVREGEAFVLMELDEFLKKVRTPWCYLKGKKQ